jgi:propanol-preferring alcohol dehydrogenase
MKAVKLLGNKNLNVIEIPKPKPQKGEVVIKIMASGICRTDIELLYSKAEPIAIIPGHEVSGIVDDTNAVKKFKRNDRVMLNCHSTCGKCEHCQNGDLIFCPQLKTLGFELNGGDAEYLVAPESMLRRLPDDITYESGVVLSDALGTAYHAAKKAKIRKNSTVGIIGMGPLGLMCVVCVKYFGGKVVAIDLIPERLKSAEHFGADTVLNPNNSDIIKYIDEYTQSKGLDIVIDFSGSPEAISIGADLLKAKGRLILGGVCSNLNFDPFRHIISKELTIIGTRNYHDNELEDMLTLAREKPFIQDIITHKFKISDAKEAFQIAERREGIKVIFIPSGT